MKILGRERPRFGRLGSGTRRKGSSLKVVCVATIKSKKLKRLSFSAPAEASPLSAVVSNLLCAVREACWGLDGGKSGRR